jgi:uncharacterized protein YdcH (DUF465 family)
MTRDCRNHHHACDCREARFMRIIAERDALKEEVMELRNSREKTPMDKAIAEYCALVKQHLEEHQRILDRDMKELEAMEKCEKMKVELKDIHILGIPITAVEGLGDNVLIIKEPMK